MSRPLQLTHWHGELTRRFPDLPATTIFVLALYSMGLIFAKVSGLSTVALVLTKHLALGYHAVRKRLREFYLDASDKSGSKQGIKRRDFDVSTCFAPLLRWVLSLWSGRCLALALDVTNLGDRFHVLCISVVVRGVGIPVAWAVLLGGVKDPWNPHWLRLLSLLKTAVPDDWTVLALSDRGLESSQLYRHIVKLGWHPLMRVKKGGTFRPKGWGKFYSMGNLVQQVGGTFAAEGRAYSSEKLSCVLLARWDAGYAEPWLLLTDLPPEAANAIWYGLRSWIEQGFKVIKGGGWHWDKTRMEDAERVERFWLVLAVSTLWVVALGVEDEVREENEAALQKLKKELAESQEQTAARLEQERLRLAKQRQAQEARRARLEKRRAARVETKTQKAKKSLGATKAKTAQQRTHRVTARGLAVLAALWQNGQNRLPQHLHPEPWLPPCHPGPSVTEEEFLSQQT